MAEEFTASQAVDALAAFTRVFRAAEHLHKAASWAANMEQVQRELTEQVEFSRTTLKALQDELNDERAAVAAERAKGKKAAEAAQAKAAAIVEEAEAKALEITTIASETAAQAHEAAEAAKARADACEAEVLKAGEELAAINQKLADARAAIANLLGTAAA